MDMQKVLFFLCLAVVGCARPWVRIDLAGIEPAREKGLLKAGAWLAEEEGVANRIPDNATREELSFVQNDAGVSLGLVKDLAVRDLVVECVTSFSGTGSPSLVFRVQEEDEVVSSMYALALNRHGVILWRLKDGVWFPLHTHVFEVEPEQLHVLRADVRANRIGVRFDNEPLFSVQDTLLMMPGRVGVRACQGPCRFHEVRIRPRDKAEKQTRE